MRTAGSTLGSLAPPLLARRGELAGSVPVQRALAGERLGEVAEHGQVGERVVAERVVARGGGVTVCHGRSLRLREPR